MLYINEAAYKTRGYTKDELMAMLLQELDAPEYARLIESRIEILLKKGSLVFESEHLRKDGTTMPVEVHARIIEYGSRGVVVSAARDITERKRAERALRESEERFRKIFEEGPLGIAITGFDFKFIRVNERLSQMLGYSEEELTRLTFADVTCPEDIDKDVSLARKLFAGEITFFSIEKRYITTSLS